ncbi:MAG: 3-phosphoshikimate 1-carboxyvinyltransferase, partial [Lachnospiraceae bacterium]|nr:3-phosphoshikimate 1-carboxyvinyltransferase [Lachnospiraceae bacterium]
KIKTYGDHRIAMSFAIAEVIGKTRFGNDFSLPLDDPDCVKISYPEFFQDLEKLCR